MLESALAVGKLESLCSAICCQIVIKDRFAHIAKEPGAGGSGQFMKKYWHF